MFASAKVWDIRRNLTQYDTISFVSIQIKKRLPCIIIKAHQLINFNEEIQCVLVDEESSVPKEIQAGIIFHI